VEIFAPGGIIKTMDARLLVAHANADAKQIRLGAETLIGRSPECNLRIASGQVSRRHCLIKVADERVLVRDLGSANGTRLNGQAIAAEQDVPIPPGSTLVVGPLKFIVQFTPPKDDGDTELLYRSGQGESSETHDVQAMATAPMADGEETKDYPPSRTRKRGVPPPFVVSGENADSLGDQDPSNADRERGQSQSVQARSTEADFGPVSSETVFDVSLEDQAAADAKRRRDAAGAERPPVGAETDFVFEEEDLRQLASAIEDELAARPAPEASATEGAPDPQAAQQAGWRFLDMLRRPKKPAAAPGEVAPPPPAAASGDDDALQKFLKDQ
jgi:pSer/pThr/pTyr-binding forkhead associated (FHA) protein